MAGFATTTAESFGAARGNLAAPVPSLVAAVTPLEEIPTSLEPIDTIAAETVTAVEESRSDKIFGE
jgi:hypothetical protein